MSKAKITHEFPCCPDGHTEIKYKPGAIVTGQVADWAVAAKCAVRMFDKKEPLENKATKPSRTKKAR